ncbi:MAG: hypothetical protein ABMA13_07450 [Chthoniobacteraceae bacterium]
MPKTLTLLALACSVFAATAQERIEDEQLAKAATRLAERAADQENLPLKIDLDVANAAGMKVKEYGAILIPAKGLSKESLAKGGDAIVPLGHLWMLKLAPVADRKTVAPEKLRIVTVSGDDKQHTLLLLCLGFRTTAAGDAELVIFGKDKDPIVTLSASKTDNTQDEPLDLNMRQGVGTLGDIEINVLGQFRAELPVNEFSP